MNNNIKEPIIIDFDSEIYSQKAIKNACYDFTDRAGIQIKKLSSDNIRVCLTPLPDKATSIDSLISC